MTQDNWLTSEDLLQGKLVRLTAEDTQVIAEAFCRWWRDTGYSRLSTTDPARSNSVKMTKEWIEEHLSNDQPDNYHFMIRTLEEDRLIGDIGLDGIDWKHGEAFVGISIGERSDWGKGYGSDAMRILLKYAFHELNLHRVSLDVFEYNPRAIRSYEKVGFVFEGRTRKFLNREGQRWDMIFMGILLSEWEAHICTQ